MGHISIFRRSSLIPGLSRSIGAAGRQSVRLFSSLRADVRRHLKSANAHLTDWAPQSRGRLRSAAGRLAAKIATGLDRLRSS
jgi:hypothetical protein